MRAKTKPAALPPTRSKPLRGMAERVRTADSASWVRLHSRNSLALFRDAAQRVPAYRDFLKEHGIQAEKIRTRKDFEKIPTTSKATYLKKYPLADLCWDGILGQPAVFSSTSGSTGHPFYFQRHKHLDEESSILSELFLANGEHLPGPKNPTLVIIGFGMGVWIGGTITYSAFDIASRRGYPVSILPAGVNKTEILKALRDLAPSFKQTILIGYPPYAGYVPIYYGEKLFNKERRQSYLCCCGKNNSAIGTLKARAIFSMLSSEMLRTPRSQWVMNVRCSPVSNARNSCDQPRSVRIARIFVASTSRAKPAGWE